MPKLPVDDKWDDAVESLLELSGRGEDDQRRPRPWTARWARPSSPGGGRGGSGIPTKGPGGRKPRIRRQAGRQGRSRRLLSFSRPIRGWMLRSNGWPPTVVGVGARMLGLYPDAIGRILPVAPRRRSCRRRHLGCGDRRGLGRQQFGCCGEPRRRRRWRCRRAEHRQHRRSSASNCQAGGRRRWRNATSSPARSQQLHRQDGVVGTRAMPAPARAGAAGGQAARLGAARWWWNGGRPG